MDYIFGLFILSATIGKAISLRMQYYPTGYEAVNKGVLYDLGNGFQGRYSFIHFNATGMNVAYGLWFVNATNEEYYLCLLEFKTISTATTFNPAPAQIVWCANTDGHIHAPVSSGATLTFQTDGNLVLKDTQGVSVFETGTAGQGVSYLGIHYWVNLLLVAADDTVIWKSHESPVNTLVLYQGFTNEMRLTSWSSSTNNSQGPYSMVMETGGVALYYDNSPYWVFSNSSPNTIQSVKNANTQLYAYLCTNNGKKAGLVLSSNYSNLYTTDEIADCTFFLYGSPSPGNMFYFGSTVLQTYTITTFMKLEPDGNLGAYYWDNEKYNWSRFFVLFNSLCDLPGSCGDYGICKDEKCSCPPSFVVNNLTLGCELGTKTTGFQDLQDITYFSNEYSDPDFVTQNSSACKILCDKNTSCAAAFYNQTSSYCYLAQQVRTMKWTSDQNCVAFLKLGATSAGSISKPSHHISVGIIIGSILASVVGIIIIVVAMMFKLRKSPPERKGQENNMELKSHDIPVMQEHSQHDHVVGPVRYSYSQIEELTSGFNTLIGTGGFAKVYKGVLPNYGEVAVKVLDAAWYEGKDFFAEISILEKIHHVNLVELIGYCLQEPHRILIYDYLPNGSLDKWIFGHLTSLLSWDIRFKVALGVAQGMAYLHEGCKHRILHLDLKPQNILLDSNFIPKVADFGLSRLMNKDQSIMMTNTVRGTPGYMAPDLLAEGGVTYKADVYSYGVVVLEILYGRKSGELYDKLKNVVVHENEDDESYMLDIVDISNLTPIQKKQASRALQIALLCLETDPASRPSMTKIVQMLQGLISIPSIPPTQRRLFSWGVISSSNTSKTNPSSSSAFPLSEQSTR